MPFTNEWIERGKVEGRLEGRLEVRELVIRQLRHRLGSVSAEMVEKIWQLSEARVDELGEALLDFQNLADAQTWFSKI